MPEFQDPVLGKIIVSRGRSAKYVRLGVTTTGDIRVSAPLFTPMYFIKNFVKRSRKELKVMLDKYRTSYSAEAQVGKSHRLVVLNNQSYVDVSYKKPNITVKVPNQEVLLREKTQAEIRRYVVKALRIEAKAYLPRRVEYLAQHFGFGYKVVKFSHARGRWGSCNSDGSISLNIALMKLPFELIDYVILHELAHTKYLNHSVDFWQLVESCDPNYKIHRKKLKNYSPHI